jgi:hypothetical protein
MSKTFPTKIYNFIVADSIREEAGTGKVTIIGSISGGFILLKEKNLPTAIPLALLAVFRDGKGSFLAKVRIFDPKNNQMGPDGTIGTVEKEPNKTMQLILNLGIFPIIQLGTFRVQIHLDNNVYEDFFTVDFAP